jgi:hypothetical protein
MNNDFVENGAVMPLDGNGLRVAKRPPSAISNHLRDELIRILQTGDDKHDGAFTVAIAAQVEKFIAAAREILMTENLAQNDLASLMMMRNRHTGPWGNIIGSSLSETGLPMPYPITNNENFGVQAIRQVVDAVRTIGESPAKLVDALAAARSHGLADVVAALEKKLGVVSKTEESTSLVADPDGERQ